MKITMEMRQLEIFVRVARDLNFSKAAEKMNLSQPSVSLQVNALEKCLGAQLLARSTKEVSLTKAGRDFLLHAQKILSLRDQALRSLGGEDLDAPGSLDIVSSTVPAQHLLPEIIAPFQKQRPNLIFRVDQADSRQVERMMSGFRYDFGLVGTLPAEDRLIRCPVYDDELVLAVPKEAPESPEEIRGNFADYIRRAPFIMRESGSGTRAEIESLLSKTGLDPRDLRIRAYFSDAHSILLAVARGMGVSLVSRVSAAGYAASGLLRVVEMNSPLFRRRIYLVHNKELWLSPLQKAFADHARQFYRREIF
ncbi:MAG: LysR family transcriptional regulator [Candidatus Adiutrix sp.]|jgi:DNA-binding transcriptional LysR family regulator|nr:LysR family transcriptional regulator [Candidatus Adiutrix sp.]